jgi:hypothetical protein
MRIVYLFVSDIFVGVCLVIALLYANYSVIIGYNTLNRFYICLIFVRNDCIALKWSAIRLSVFVKF